jgi:hypothetical protein
MATETLTIDFDRDARVGIPGRCVRQGSRRPRWEYPHSIERSRDSNRSAIQCEEFLPRCDTSPMRAQSHVYFWDAL